MIRWYNYINIWYDSLSYLIRGRYPPKPRQRWKCQSTFPLPSAAELMRWLLQGVDNRLRGGGIRASLQFVSLNLRKLPILTASSYHWRIWVNLFFSTFFPQFYYLSPFSLHKFSTLLIASPPPRSPFSIYVEQSGHRATLADGHTWEVWAHLKRGGNVCSKTRKVIKVVFFWTDRVGLCS